MIESRLDQNFALKSFYMQLNLAFRKKEEEKKTSSSKKRTTQKLFSIRQRLRSTKRNDVIVATVETSINFADYCYYSPARPRYSPHCHCAPNVAVRNDVYLSARRRRCTIER